MATLLDSLTTKEVYQFCLVQCPAGGWAESVHQVGGAGELEVGVVALGSDILVNEPMKV